MAFTALTPDFLGDLNDKLTVYTETSPKDTLDRIAAEFIDCIVSDYRDPGGAPRDRLRFRVLDGDDSPGYELSIVPGIVETHGWTIEIVECQLGGARFEIREVST